MPGRDGTGPFGTGMAQGRQLGRCAHKAAGRGAGLLLGLGCGAALGLGHRFGKAARPLPTEERKAQLEQHKKQLEMRLAAINNELNAQ